MGHVTKFLLIFRNNSRPNEKRNRFEREVKQKVLSYVSIVKNLYNYKNKNFFENFS